MKASTFSTTTTFLIVAFGMMTFLFFGFSTFSSITYSADVVSDNLEFLNTIDATHMLKSCLEGPDGVITDQDVMQFSKGACESIFPAMKEIDFEYMIEDMESHGDPLISESPGYSNAYSGSFLTGSLKSHYLFISIATSEGVHAGRIDVQIR